MAHEDPATGTWTPPPTGPRSDVLLAVVVEVIAHGGIPLNSMDDIAALYAWLVAIVPTCQDPPPLTSTSPPGPLLAHSRAHEPT